jgi:hypothetical protein
VCFGVCLQVVALHALGLLRYKYALLWFWTTLQHNTPLIGVPRVQWVMLTYHHTHLRLTLQCSHSVHKLDLLMTSWDCALLAAAEASASDTEEEEEAEERYTTGDYAGSGGRARLDRRSEEVLSQGAELNKVEGGQHRLGR